MAKVGPDSELTDASRMDCETINGIGSRLFFLGVVKAHVGGTCGGQTAFLWRPCPVSAFGPASHGVNLSPSAFWGGLEEYAHKGAVSADGCEKRRFFRAVSQGLGLKITSYKRVHDADATIVLVPQHSGGGGGGKKGGLQANPVRSHAGPTNEDPRYGGPPPPPANPVVVSPSLLAPPTRSASNLKQPRPSRYLKSQVPKGLFLAGIKAIRKMP